MPVWSDQKTIVPTFGELEELSQYPPFDCWNSLAPSEA